MIESRSVETCLPLTPRQRQVANLIAQRYSQKEISRALGISETSVQRHVTAIKQRLGVNSLREIAKLTKDNEVNGGWENPTVRKNDVSAPLPPWPNPSLDEPYVLGKAELEAMNLLSSMPVPNAPRIVPRLLDGKYRVPLRLAIIAAIVFASFAAIILAVAAIRSVSELVHSSPPN